MQQDSKMIPSPNEQQAAKLTSWSKEPTLQQLKGDLEAAKPSHDAMMSQIQKWQDLMKITGNAKAPNVKGRSTVQPKLIRRQAEWRYSALTEPFLGSPKVFKVSGVTWEDSEAAKQNELVLNHQFRTKLNKVKFIDDFVRTNVDEGTCILRTGWKRVTKMVKEPAPVYAYIPLEMAQDVENFQKALEFKQEDPRHFDENMDPLVKAAVEFYEETGQVTTAQQVGTELVDVEKVLENRPTVEIMNPNNVFIDPSCQGDLDKAQFVAISFETCKADLLKEAGDGKTSKYIKSQLRFIDWNSNSPLATPDHETTTPTDFQFADALRKKVVAYEWWGYADINNTGEMVPIVVTWIGNTIIRMQENPFPDQKLPFIITNYLPVKRELYGEPDAELLEDQQRIIGAVTRGMIDLLGKSANSQQGFAKGMLDALNRRRYDSGQDYEFNPNQNPANQLIQHKYPEIPQSALVLLNLQNQEAESLTGVKSFAGGISGDAYGTVATGIRGALDAASKREMAILRRLAKGIAELGSRIISMNGEFLSDKEVIRITNEQYITVSREDLLGNFDMEVDISTAEVDNQKSQDLAFMLQTLGPNSDPSFTRLILTEIAELKRMPELAHKIKTFQPQPDPVEEQKKQLEIQNLMLENQKIQSEIEYNLARAEQARANKDKTNLDYLEQETGTAHARRMQEMQSQAQGNQNLEITKALVKPSKEGEKSPDIAAAVGYNALSQMTNNQGQPG